MKNVQNFFIVVFICLSVLFVASCTKESSLNQKGIVKFSLGLGSTLKSTTIADSSGITDSITNYYALVTIVDNNGQVVYNSKKLAIFQFGKEYVSETLLLETGTYKLTGFIILKGSNTVYAAPVSGSTRAPLVNYPLPLAFSINSNGTTLVAPEVLLTETTNPEEFGYSSFGFSIVETTVFKIIAYGSSSSDTANAISALLNVRISNDSNLGNSDTTQFAYKAMNFQLEPAVNSIEVNAGVNYSLVVSKPGYTGWSSNFTASELSKFHTYPLKVYLTPVVIHDSINLTH